MTRYRIGHLQVVIEPFGQTYNYVTETGVLPNLANGPAGSKVISFDFCIVSKHLDFTHYFATDRSGFYLSKL